MAFSDAAHTYTMLTIGDGLVAQIPGLVISIAAGVTVSRVNTEQDVGQQMMGQLFSRPRVLMMTAGVMGLLGLVPGMPNLVFSIPHRAAGRVGLVVFQTGRTGPGRLARADLAAQVGRAKQRSGPGTTCSWSTP